MKQIKALIVQPHSDDALFSVGHMLFNPMKYDVRVLTVENDSRRLEEDNKVYAALNIPHQAVEGIDPAWRDDSFYGFYNRHPLGVTVENSLDWLANKFGVEQIMAIAGAVGAAVTKSVQEDVHREIFVPLGIGHPFHVFIRSVVESALETCGGYTLKYYRDWPHSYKKRVKNQLIDTETDYTLEESWDVTRFADAKWTLARKFYKSQSGLLWFEQGYIAKNLPEEIWVRKGH